MEDGRLQRAHQLAVAVDRQGQARPPLRPAARSAAGVLQAGRRRLRRQAGSDLRGSGRAGHARHRAAGVLRVHPRRGVHHGVTAAPDDDHGQARCQGRRHADRVPVPQRVQHRRLRQPRRRDVVRRAGRRSRYTVARTRNSTRVLGLHEHRAQRSAARLRHDAAGVRRRVRHARAGRQARHGSAGAAASQHRPTRGRPVGHRRPSRRRGVHRGQASASASTSSTPRLRRNVNGHEPWATTG